MNPLIESIDIISFLMGGAVALAVCTLVFVLLYIRQMKKSLSADRLAEEKQSLEEKLTEKNDDYLSLLEAHSALKEQKNALEQARNEMANHFKSLSQEALNASAQQFMTLAQEKFKQWDIEQKSDLEKRSMSIHEMVKPVQKNLETINQSIEQIKGTDQALSKELKSLQQETAKIAGAMHNPASRGKWGEYVLERLLERSGLVKDIHFQTQNTIASGERTLRPDIIIHLQDDMRIVIDSKAPVQDIVDDLQDGEKEKDVAAKLAKAVRAHVKALGQKSYQDSMNSPDFVVLFLPAEHLFSMAVSADPALIDYAAENNIVLASPILILSILRVVKMSWQSHDLAENARDIAEAGATLYKRLGVFTEHLDKMGNSMQTSIKHYNNAIGSFERNVLPQAKKFEELHALSTPQSLEAPKSLEIAPRTVLKQAD